MGNTLPNGGIHPFMADKDTEHWAVELDMLRAHGQNRLAKNLESLRNESVSNRSTVNDESVARMVRFMTTNGNQILPKISISVSPETYIHGEWNHGDKSVTVVIFLPDGGIRFAAIANDEPQVNLSGTMHAEEFLTHICLFWKLHVPEYAGIDKTGETPI